MIQVYDKYGKIKSSGLPGSGTVTSFSAGNLSPLFNSTVTSPTSTPNISFSKISQAQNLFYASPNGSSGVPTFRALVAADIPTLTNYVPTSRTLTINGVTFDLSANRSWTVTASGVTWGSITGTLTAQTDLTSYLSTNYFPIPVGTISQYIDGTGAFQTFPTIPTITPAALTKTDDTNVTLTLGGTPATALLQATSLTLGWTGTLADSRIASASTWNAKQNALSGTGIVKSTAGTISYISGTSSQFVKGDGTLDSNTYLTSAVTSVTATSPITSSGGNTPVISTSMATNKLIGRSTAGTGVMEEITIGTGLTLSGGILNGSATGVTSVGLSMPSAFTVTNSPVTTSGTLTVTGAGLISQYVRGDGTLANFPASTGGGASLSFYLNGSVSQGTFGGVAFREMDRTPILGAGTNFTINTNGYIQSFITDAGVPNLLEIPAGNWNFETYFSASSGGGSPSFYVELYKWNGTTLSLIASSSANPEGITNGTVTDLYVSALAVPQTTLLATDRLAVRIYVNNSGRTITLHTEDNNLCQVITTFSTGLTALNGLTTQVQNLAVGTSGTDFGISSSGSTHTFNLPSASALNRGALLAADWTTFNNKMNAAQLAMLTANDAANNTTTPVVLTGHTFTIPAGKTAEITAIMMFTTALATVGAIYGIRVANPTGANGNVIGTSFITVGVSSAPSAGAFQDGDNFNVGANSNSFSSVTGTAATATNNNPANLIATIRNLSTNTSATITIEFASEVGGTDITPQLGTSANCKILN